MDTNEIKEWLERHQVYPNDFSLETSEADPFIFEWYSHSRPGPSFFGSEIYEILTDGEDEWVTEGSRYDYPCFDDSWGKGAVSNWSWILLYHYRKYVTDDDATKVLRFLVRRQKVADELLPVISEVMRFAIASAIPSETENLTSLIRDFVSKKATFKDLKAVI